MAAAVVGDATVDAQWTVEESVVVGGGSGAVMIDVGRDCHCVLIGGWWRQLWSLTPPSMLSGLWRSLSRSVEAVVLCCRPRLKLSLCADGWAAGGSCGR